MRAGKVVKGLGMAAVALTLVSACMVGSTLAKYTSEVAGTGTVLAAKWALKANLNGEEASDSTLGSFALADTVNTNGIETGRIAPGTSGEIKVAYDLRGSEVGANVKVQMKLGDGAGSLPENLVFKDSKGNVVNVTSSSDFVDVASEDIALADIKAASTPMSCTITWEWPLEKGDDDAAKKLANKADSDYAESAVSIPMDIKVVATQIAPSTPVTP